MKQVSEQTITIQKPSFQTWLFAARPRTLPVSLPPIIVGTALASREVDALNWLLVISALLFSLAIQIGTNLVNDAFDFKKGVDTKEKLARKMTQEGWLTSHQLLCAGCFSLCLGLVLAIPLMVAGGWPLVCVLIACAACGYFYTGGPYPLSYTGLSDLFVLIFFGWVSTATVYFIQTGTVSAECVLGATQIGLLAIVPHAINNLRDRKTDELANKRTLAVRFGAVFGRWEIIILSLLPFVMGVAWLVNGSFLAALLPLLAFPFVAVNLRSIWLTEPSSEYNQFLAKSAVCQLLFGCLLGTAIMIS